MSFTLKACRVNKNLTQAEAAKALGITEDTLANYEAGRTFPDVRVVKKIELLYGVPFANIIFFED